MKMKLALCFLCLNVPSQLFGRSTIYRAEKSAERIPVDTPNRTATSRPPPLNRRTWSMVVNGNPIVAQPGPMFRELDTIRSGDMFFARITHSVIAFSDSKTSISARIYDVSGKDYVLIGEATLEKASKRILLNFRALRETLSHEVYEVAAQGLALDGTLGVVGEYVTGESKLFAAELAAAAAAGFADASISRNTNVLGQVQDDNSLDTRSKKALGSALSRTADRFAEKQKQSPEYSVLSGPVSFKILFIETPKRKL